MKRWSLTLVAVSLLALSGCDKIASTFSAKSEAKAVDITGKWEGKIEMHPSKSDDPMAKMGEAMVGMLAGTMTLEIMPGDKFKMSVMGMPVEGSFTRDGSSMTLTAEKAMGMPMDQAMKDNKSFKNDKLYATISEDGNKIVVKTKDDKPEDGQMVFVRAKDAPKKEVENSTVSAGEAGYVGSYGAEMTGEKPAGLKPSELEDLKMAEAMLASSTLDLYADNTFKMKMMFEVEGTWKEEGAKLRLHMTKMMGMPDGAKSSTEDDLMLDVSVGKLFIAEPGPGGVKLAFVKK